MTIHDMKRLNEFSDEEIDALLFLLFNGKQLLSPKKNGAQLRSVENVSNEELLRIRSKNHPDKWPNVNQEAYQAAVEELDKRRLHKKQQ